VSDALLMPPDFLGLFVVRVGIDPVQAIITENVQPRILIYLPVSGLFAGAARRPSNGTDVILKRTPIIWFRFDQSVRVAVTTLRGNPCVRHALRRDRCHYPRRYR
jgi:hypothetical protein